jgi:hypothetical protein
LRELGIEWIAAHSPQAKGRIERCFGTLQDRLVKALRKAKVRTMPEANACLEQVFLPMWNQRFVRKPANAVNGHRELGRVNLASSLSVMETRRVANDYTVQWRGVRWQIPREAIRPGLRGTTLRIEQRLDGTMVARDGSKFLSLLGCESEPAVESPNRSPHHTNRRPKAAPKQSRWMDGFRVKGNEQWRAYRDERSKLPAASG